MLYRPIIDQLEKLIEISIAISSRIEIKKLLEMILVGAKSITAADAGALYYLHNNQLQMKIMLTTSLNLWCGGTSKLNLNLPEIPLYHKDGHPNLSNVASYCCHKKLAVNIANAYQNDLGFDFSGTKAFDELNHYLSQSFLSVPLINHENDVIGVLQLINAINPNNGQIVAFDKISQRFTEALASLAALVLTQQHLIFELETMFETSVQLIATAIDDKSPYTGEHCRRVPELTMLLAEAAHKTTEGYLKDFTLSNADRYELQIASWLHDCGKITTPEYVIDKATKLQTIFDRLELIQTRFEVLKRDARINMLEQILDNPAEKASFEKKCQAEIQRIEEDFAFIKQANTGSESMSLADQQRIKDIAGKFWQQNGQSLPLLSADEVDNLSIVRGTLTAAERKIIDHHIVATIAMLEKIHFPKHLQHVPEYAGGHHERIDGKGYPKGLTREQMSIQARIIAIADIFEALTASDRPYKTGKKLSQALQILKTFKDNQHIDPDLYEVFIREKVYLHYAQKFLSPENIDID
jgi:HD-GYP domain-containing protein (c-di-GMP phosphodiesterase class II)